MNKRREQAEDLVAFESQSLTHRVKLTDAQTRKLQAYRDNLVAWNDRVRLVSRSDSSRFLTRHALESLLTQTEIGKASTRLADIGSGGGLPGIPLAISSPHINVTLIESARMKCLFLNDTIKTLPLTNVEVIHDRVENVWETRSSSYDVVTARAVASIEHVWELAEPLLKPQGKLVALKGPGEAEEGLGPLGIAYEERVIELENRMLAIVIVRKK